MSRTPPHRFSAVRSTAEWGGRVTRAEIDLDAIETNVREIARHVGRAGVLAVVKADAYGHGAPPVARAALRGGAERLAVYTVDEGVALRRGGIEAPILVFGPFTAPQAPSLWEHRLTPTLLTLDSALQLARCAAGPALPFHLKVDTGLTRSGISPREVLPLLNKVSSIPSLQPEGIYTHFARADEPRATTSREQLGIFLELVRQLEEEGFHFPLRHAANSAATLTFPDAHLDLVRVGIGMYGYAPCPDSSGGPALRPALSLISCITRLTDVMEGTGVGYGHVYRAPGDRRIALVPIGYADGLRRSLGCGIGAALVRGRRAPIVGRISMDQITLDVTDVPDVSLGDEVMLIGRQGKTTMTADDIAESIGTISYELLSGIAPRVPRLYVRNGTVSSVRRPFESSDEPYAIP